MTLSEMADYVCEVYGKTDDATKATAKKFLRHRHNMICDADLWKDMVGVIRFPNKTRTVYLPEDVDRVMHVTFGDVSMEPIDLLREAISDPANISQSDIEFSPVRVESITFDSTTVTFDSTQYGFDQA